MQFIEPEALIYPSGFREVPFDTSAISGLFTIGPVLIEDATDDVGEGNLRR